MKSESLLISVSGVRGVVGPALNAEEACKLASAYGTWASPGAVVVGRDSRLSGPMLRHAVVAGLLSTGHDVVDLGVATTPSTEIMVTTHGAAGGIIITASHNPEPWNALKLLCPDGTFLSAAQGEAVQALARAGDAKHRVWDEIGALREDTTAAEVHIRSILELPLLDRERIAARRFHVVVDCGNGAGGVVAPELLRQLGARVTEMNCEPTGRFGRPPEPTPANLDALAARVREVGADVGFATDPDADRLGIVAETGEALFEEYTLAIVTEYLLAHKPGPVVVNLSTTSAMDDICARHGVALWRTPVGEAHVVAKMLEVGAIVGGEGNGGVILPVLHPGRDAMVGMALILQSLAESGRSLSSVFASLPQYHMIKRSLPLRRVLADEELVDMARREFDGTIETGDGVKVTLPDGWVHLRRSNTEPIVRAIAESRTPGTAESLVDRAMRRFDAPSGTASR